MSGQEGTPNGVDRLAQQRETLVGALNEARPSPDWAWEVLNAWDALVELAREVPDVIEGLLEIAAMAMPDSYFSTDSRIVAARVLLARLDRSSA